MRHLRKTPEKTYCGRAIEKIAHANLRTGPGSVDCERCLSGWEALIGRRSKRLAKEMK